MYYSQVCTDRCKKDNWWGWCMLSIKMRTNCRFGCPETKMGLKGSNSGCTDRYRGKKMYRIDCKRLDSYITSRNRGKAHRCYYSLRKYYYRSKSSSECMCHFRMCIFLRRKCKSISWYTLSTAFCNHCTHCYLYKSHLGILYILHTDMGRDKHHIRRGMHWGKFCFVSRSIWSLCCMADRWSLCRKTHKCLRLQCWWLWYLLH